jgi:hypothetical protein
MKVRLVRSGGVAGMRLAAEMDSARLPEEGARHLARLVEESGVLALPAHTHAGATGPDRFAYRLTVETEGREHTVEIAEEDLSPAIEPLIDWLVSRARERTALG